MLSGYDPNSSPQNLPEYSKTQRSGFEINIWRSAESSYAATFHELLG
jgi:hypothetical protein